MKSIGLNKNISYSSVDDRDALAIIRYVNNGISYAVFWKLVKQSLFSMEQWSGFLSLSQRTLERYESENKKFDKIHSEKIVQIFLLYNYGLEVFGDKKKFNLWLNTENLAFGKIKPVELIDNSFGIDLVKDELGRIEHGVLA